MFNFSAPSLNGSGYIILNILRAFSIITCTSLATSSVIYMVTSAMPNAFTFFNDVALFVTVVMNVGLIASEIPSSKIAGWIDHNWPMFGPRAGLTWLGTTMIGLGSHTLGRLSDPRNNRETLPLAFWRLCLASGILGIVFGTFNIAASRVWSGMVRNVRSQGATAQDNEYYPDAHSGYATSQRSDSVKNEKRQRRSFFAKHKPKISHPIPHTDVEHGMSDGYPESRQSPILPGVERPPSALHPAVIGGRGPYTYSVASGFGSMAGNRI